MVFRRFSAQERWWTPYKQMQKWNMLANWPSGETVTIDIHKRRLAASWLDLHNPPHHVISFVCTVHRQNKTHTDYSTPTLQTPATSTRGILPKAKGRISRLGTKPSMDSCAHGAAAAVWTPWVLVRALKTCSLAQLGQMPGTFGMHWPKEQTIGQISFWNSL